MHASSDDILDLVRTREVTGVFHSRKALDAAVQDLLLADVDRADIDVSASVDELQRRLNYNESRHQISPIFRPPPAALCG